jgi:hypothetical protein
MAPPVAPPSQTPPDPFNVDNYAFDPPPRVPIASASAVQPIKTIATGVFCAIQSI